LVLRDKQKKGKKMSTNENYQNLNFYLQL